MPVTTRLKHLQLQPSDVDNHFEEDIPDHSRPIERTATMTAHIDSTPMEMEIDSIDLPTTAGINIRAKSPTKSDSGKSDSSSLSYTDDFKTLPSSGPTSHAHILDLGEYAATMKEEGALKLQDAVVTTLFNISPATLKAFVNPTVNTFKAVFGSKNVQLVIWRKGLEVFVSRHLRFQVYHH
jgi:hypothetical protein